MSSSSGSAERTLDLRGEVCPYTFVHTKLELESMQPGEWLCVVVDHEPATRNVPRSAREWGQQVGEIAPIPGESAWTIRIQKRTTERL